MIPSLIAYCSTWRWQPRALARIAQCAAAFGLGLLALVSNASSAQTLRVVTYNIQAGDGIDSNLTTVLQAIGNVHLNSNAQPIDVLALQELATSPTTTTLPFVISQLNAVYGSGTYAFDSTSDPTTGGTGGGPSGLVYNTKTVKFLGAAVIGSASGSGAPRAPMRYKLAPKGYDDHSADFFIYVSHMKSGTGTSNEDRRQVEANTIRTNSATATVGANAHVIYAGDYNLNGSYEDAYQTMTTGSTVGRAIDTLISPFTPPNPANYWDTTSTYESLFTESATFVEFRDDFQFVTDPMIVHSGTENFPGMKLISSTLGAFGNGGNVYHNPVTDSSNSAALSEFNNQQLYPPGYRTTVLNALTTATDHLPVVADYSFATAVGAAGDYDHSGVVNPADYTLWRSTYGQTGANLLADGNHNNIVDMADFVIWRRNTTGAGAGTLDSGSQVPEPAACLLMLLGCLACPHRSKLRG